MILKYELVSGDAVAPRLANDSDVGYDLTAVSIKETATYVEYDTGIRIQPPKNYYTELLSRSSLSKYDLILCNGVGVIDPDYRGTLRFRFKKVPRSIWQLLGLKKYKIYNVGDKIGQLVIRRHYNKTKLQEDSIFVDTGRSVHGFGSSGA